MRRFVKPIGPTAAVVVESVGKSNKENETTVSVIDKTSHALSSPSFAAVVIVQSRKHQSRHRLASVLGRDRRLSPDDNRTNIIVVVDNSVTEQDNSGNRVGLEKISQFQEGNTYAIVKDSGVRLVKKQHHRHRQGFCIRV